ncbi:hypothetical protein E1J38_004345 [Seonamhaeicola sediminis]|uniref:Carboxypeptidase-like regulatory domain-containing protein n=1 Tax=Seonamhaeicola sediminis TaxID=2528206 RepID=A0A562YHL3_9FLAO|nr:hypothetical protein [Seonamhaeicola sediminis]TWO34014.1 hypothetical protein E1J38_004345 [Seonamhaeicola sediminis]
MKNILALTLFLVMSCILNGQTILKGNVWDGELGYPGVSISLENTEILTFSDFDGNFQLDIPKSVEKGNVIFKYVDLAIKIENFKFKTAIIDLGKVIIPLLKHIDPSEYIKLPKEKQKNIQPVTCWGQILGYIKKDELEKDNLILNCGRKIKNYSFNSKTGTIAIDYSEIRNCIKTMQ